jgi:hypothetical protein
MDKAQLGQLIKQKYSAYENIDNEQLADMVIAKYPTYQSQIDPSTSYYEKSQPGSPIMKTLAKIQTNLGTTNTLPGAYAGAGLMSGNPAVAGILGGLGMGLKNYVAKSLNPETTTGGQMNIGGKSIPVPYGVVESKKGPLDYATNTLKDVKDVGVAGGKTAVESIILNAIFKAISGVLHPMKTASNIRSASLGETAYPKSALNESGDLSKMITSSQDYMAAPEATKQAVTARYGDLTNMLNSQAEPGGFITKNSIYKSLTPFESQGGAYGTSNAATSQATEIVSRTMRDYMSNTNPAVANMANKFMQILYKIKPLLPKAIGYGGGLGLGAYALNKTGKALSSK